MVREEVRLWLDSAEEDIYDAKLALANKRWFRAAFFAQQAVEKMLKALYPLLAREPPPHTHRVSELYRRLKQSGFSVPEELEKRIPLLNKYYTITRYPDAANGLPSESVDEDEARKAVDLAEELMKHVREEVERRS